MKRSYLAPTLLLSLALVAIACSDDGDDNPKPPDVGTAGTKTTAGSGGKAPGTAGSTGNNGGAPNPEGGGGSTTTDGGEPPVVAGNGQGGAPTVECDLPELGKDGCFNCPNAQVEYLNRCSDGDCLPFDNAERLPLLKADGSLPDLPN
jgi:hypothetical protein